MNDQLNDNDAVNGGIGARAVDSNGQAAMLLVESLLHGLIERSVLSTEQAVEIVEGASDAAHEIAIDSGDEAKHMQHSLTLLTAITQSLSGRIQQAS